jgi:hypothetical protein
MPSFLCSFEKKSLTGRLTCRSAQKLKDNSLFQIQDSTLYLSISSGFWTQLLHLSRKKIFK